MKPHNETMTQRLFACALLAGVALAQPSAEIDNGQLRAKLYLPDAAHGFYRGTRFDWSGTIYSLKYQGHEYYGPWFNRTDPKIRDFIYEGSEIVAGPCSSTTGPADEFSPLGWDSAKPGGTFVKIGVGALRKPEEGRYESFRLFEIADGGKWSVRKSRTSVEFTHRLTDRASGYGYLYRKVVRLSPGAPEMILEHSLKNTGRLALDTSVYNHNFLILDGNPPGAGMTIAAPFEIRSQRPPRKELAGIHGKQIAYAKALEGRDVAACPIEGFGASADDHRFRIEDTKAGIGMSLAGDRPLHRVALWSIRSVMAVEPFVAIAVEPGREFTWKTTYRYYTLSDPNRD